MALHLPGTALGAHSNIAFALLPESQSLLLSLGPHLRVLSIQTLQPTLTFQATQDYLIAVLPLSGQRMAGVSVSGEIAVFSEAGEELSRLRCEGLARCATASENGSLIAICSDSPARVSLWEVGEKTITAREEMAGIFRLAEITPRGQLFTVTEGLCPSTRSRILPSLHLIEGGREVAHASLNFSETRVTAWRAAGEFVALLFQSRWLAVVSMNSLQTVKALHIEGSGMIHSCWLQGTTVYLSPGSGLFTSIDVTAVEEAKVDPFVENARGIVSVKTSQEWLSMDASWLSWHADAKRVVVCNESGVYRGEFLDYPSSSKMTYTSFSYHKSGCTSASLSPSGTHLCSGDDTGQVIVWDVQSAQLLGCFQLFVPVNDLVWLPDGDYIVGATKVGSVFCISHPLEAEAEVSEILSYSMSPLLLASRFPLMVIACSEIVICDFTDPLNPEQVSSITYSSMNNGRSSKSHSLLALQWSPSKSRSLLAIGSADHLVTIWSVSGTALTQMTSLGESSSEITDIAWECVSHLSSVSEILVSCSKDGQLRVYDSFTWRLMLVFSSSSDPYLSVSLEKAGSRLLASTAAGRLSLYDLPSCKRLKSWLGDPHCARGRLRWSDRWLVAACSTNSVHLFAVCRAPNI